jgi:hypothetical protein
VEQQSGAPGAAQAQAARTVLPGEPFDPPAASQVPAPRPAEQGAPPAAPPAEWNYQPMAAPAEAFGQPGYETMPATTFEPQPVTGSEFESLHDFASIPPAAQFGAPAPAAEAFAPAAYPPPAPVAPAAWEPQAAQSAPAEQPDAGFPPPVFAPVPSAELPPLPPEQDNEGFLAEPDKQRTRKGPDKRLLIGALVVVLGAGGYFGYTQLTKKSSTTANAPVAPVTVPVVHYDFPSNIAGLPLQSAASTAALRTSVLAEAKTWNAAAARTLSVASYSAGKPSIIAISFHPAPAQLASDYASLVRFTAAPSKGNVAVTPQIAVPGAAGGQMTCGGESGASPLSWCAWHGASTIGVLQISGSPKTEITQILTREMRAYAEH